MVSDAASVACLKSFQARVEELEEAAGEGLPERGRSKGSLRWDRAMLKLLEYFTGTPSLLKGAGSQ